MKICVVTPYYNTPLDWLIKCHQSVREQTVPAHHIMICDGSEPMKIPGFEGSHTVLLRNYADSGNTPRLIGCYQALLQQPDAIAFLDADNWFYPDHLAGLAAVVKAEDLDACSSARMLHRLDGSFMMRCPTVDGAKAIDTNCLLIAKRAFPHLVGWTIPPVAIAGVVDQWVWRFIQGMGARTAFLDAPTVAYRTRHPFHYDLAGEEPPPGAAPRQN